MHDVGLPGVLLLMLRPPSNCKILFSHISDRELDDSELEMPVISIMCFSWDLLQSVSLLIGEQEGDLGANITGTTLFLIGCRVCCSFLVILL